MNYYYIFMPIAEPILTITHNKNTFIPFKYAN